MPKNKIKPQILALSEFDLEQPFSTSTNKDTIILMSVLKDINGSPRSTQVEVHAKLAKELLKHQPKSLFLFVAGYLKRHNWWEMARELDDKTLKATLSDIPDNVNEEKLSTILAEKFSPTAIKLENIIIEKLNKQLNECLKTSDKSKIIIGGWEQRKEFKMLNKQSEKDNYSPRLNSEDFETTKNEFLHNKKSLIEKAKKRILKANQGLAKIDFDKLTQVSCYNYITEEYSDFKNLGDVELYHRRKKPKVFDPLFSGKEGPHWQAFSFREPIKNATISITRAHSTPSLSTLLNPSSSLAERRLKFFAPLAIHPATQGDATPIRSKPLSDEIKPSFSQRKSPLTPRSKDTLDNLDEILSNSPPEKRDFILEKIREIKEATSNPTASYKSR